MTLTIAARNPLIEISAALYAKNPDLVLQRIDSIHVGVRYRIYERMWEVMGRPSGDDEFGQNAFRDSRFPTPKKIEAVEKVLLEDVAPMPAPAKPVQPKNSVEMKMPAFFDTGFDPRFTQDGNFLVTPQRSLRQVVKAITGFVAYCIFVFKAYCSFSREERLLRQTILQGTALENTWSSYYVRALVTNINDPCFHWIRLAEHDFLHAVSHLYKQLNPSPSHAPRLFPSEVLAPIHCIYKPQNDSQVIEKIRPGVENLDLVRAGKSYLRLNRQGYTLAPPRKQSFSFDTFEYDYVPHYLFIHATLQSSENLKLACRQLRKQLTASTTDFKSAFSFARCKAQLSPVFSQFNQAWQGYVQSHELLTENQMVWSQADHRAAEYAAWREETKMSAKLMHTHRHDKDRPSVKASANTLASIEAAYLSHHADTKTGRLIKALQEKLPTLTV